MLAALVVALRSLALICGGHRAVALENLALRQQLSRSSFRRTGIPRETAISPPTRHRWSRSPSLRNRDRQADGNRAGSDTSVPELFGSAAREKIVRTVPPSGPICVTVTSLQTIAAKPDASSVNLAASIGHQYDPFCPRLHKCDHLGNILDTMSKQSRNVLFPAK